MTAYYNEFVGAYLELEGVADIFQSGKAVNLRGTKWTAQNCQRWKRDGN